MNKYIVIYLLAINLLSFILMKIDKVKAIKNKWRISEKTFVILSILFGGYGIIIGENMFHHKTNKFKFKVVIPFITLLELILIIYIR